MAERLLQYYNHIVSELGMEGKVRLAHETKIPAAVAAVVPDSPDNLAIFRKAVELLTGEPAPKF